MIQLGLGPLHPLQQSFQKAHPLTGLVFGLGGHLTQRPEFHDDLLQAPIGQAPPLTGGLADTFVDPQVEQRRKEVLAISRLVVQKSLKVSLRKEDTGRELFEVEPEQLLNLVRYRVGTVGEDLTVPFQSGFVGIGGFPFRVLRTSRATVCF